MAAKGTSGAAAAEMRAAALELAAAGYRVFPLYSVTKAGACTCGRKDCDVKRMGKHPRTADGFKSASADVSAWGEGWWAGRIPENVGVATGAGVVVIDVDVGGGGQDNWDALCEGSAGGVCCRTGSGGQHLWYRLPEGVRVQCSVSKLCRGVDVRGDGGYVVVPPSRHGSGNTYTWEDTDGEVVVLGALPMCPEWLLGKLERVEKERASDTVGGANAFISGERNTVLFRLSGTMRRKNMGESSIRAALIAENNEKCRPPVDEKEVSEIARKVCKYTPEDPILSDIARFGDVDGAVTGGGGEDDLQWRRALVRGKGDAYLNTAGNAVLFFCHDDDWRGCLGYDDFAGHAIWLKPPPTVGDGGLPKPKVGEELRDGHIIYAQQWLQSKYGINVSKTNLYDAVEESARSCMYHPVRDWLRELQWDGVNRVGGWLSSHFGVKQGRYSSEVGRAWLVSAVARVMRPGCQVDHMLVLEGPQGAGKSSVMRILFGEDWFLGALPDIRDKDAKQGIRGKWGVEIGELDAIRGVSASKVKDFLTQQIDDFRPAYGRCFVKQPRQCVFVGSTNEDRWMIDSTGGRRFWPVTVRIIDRDRMAKEREQLWAEAVARYDGGEKWWPKEEEVGLFEEEQEERYDIDVWEDTIIKYVDGRSTILAEHVLTLCLGIELCKVTRGEQSRVGSIMRRLGWRKKRVRVGNVLTTFYKNRDGWKGAERCEEDVSVWNDEEEG